MCDISSGKMLIQFHVWEGKSRMVENATYVEEGWGCCGKDRHYSFLISLVINI